LEKLESKRKGSKMSMPIYYVIAEWVRNSTWYGVYNIIEVVETTLEDVDSGRIIDIIDANKYRAMGRSITVYMFTIPPKDIMKEYK
jgi:hypothetical protein